MIKLISQCLRYRSIRHKDIRNLLWTFPILASTVVALLTAWSPFPPDVVGPTGLAHLVFSIVLQLPGFYIAALAAIASLRNRFLDIELPEPAPTLIVKVRGQPVEKILSLREVMLLATGYLATASFIVLLYSGAAVNMFDAPSIGAVFSFLSPLCSKVVETVLISFFLYLPFSILFATFHVIYLLSERADKAF
ncbi:hypothetical protein [Ponticaulis koreensis]|uniref:hypothetical protein n=1 Tax=Ponticaulis koreensis TaxID=1123045 RepID=UPI0003B448EA|nr:hypothetical protein [Ponticaulis koreensis]